MRRIIFLGAILVFCGGVAISGSKLRALVSPEVNHDSWVMLEIWPDVNDITLSMYFLDGSEKRNKALCEATKSVFDRDQKEKEKRLKKKLTSYRRCLSVKSAIEEGLVLGKD